uniref:Uncharacterized protein n=1 Tax=Papilio xuthus TaxID=66420 RepID=I4DLQ1_PAPXU|nr:unknown unsecreted protein [Papilio xuthus]
MRLQCIMHPVYNNLLHGVFYIVSPFYSNKDVKHFLKLMPLPSVYLRLFKDDLNTL